MASFIEDKIEELLKKGYSKEKIRQLLKKDDKDGELDFYLRNIAYPSDRLRYQFVNLSLFFILLFITLKKLYFALSFGQLSIVMLLAMVVPTVNLYILREIMRYRRIGYLFCMVLSAISLVNAENRAFPEIILVPTMVFLSAFLYTKLFWQYERDEKKRKED